MMVLQEISGEIDGYRTQRKKVKTKAYRAEKKNHKTSTPNALYPSLVIAKLNIGSR